MKRMKFTKIASLLIVVLLVFSGCSSKSEPVSTNDSNITYESTEGNEVIGDADLLEFETTFQGKIGETIDEITDDSDYYQLNGLKEITLEVKKTQVLGIIVYDHDKERITDYYTEEGTVTIDVSDMEYIEIFVSNSAEEDFIEYTIK